MYFSETESLCGETKSRLDDDAINLLQSKNELSDEDVGNQPPSQSESKWYFPTFSIIQGIFIYAFLSLQRSL